MKILEREMIKMIPGREMMMTKMMKKLSQARMKIMTGRDMIQWTQHQIT